MLLGLAFLVILVTLLIMETFDDKRVNKETEQEVEELIEETKKSVFNPITLAELTDDEMLDIIKDNIHLLNQSTIDVLNLAYNDRQSYDWHLTLGWVVTKCLGLCYQEDDSFYYKWSYIFRHKETFAQC